MPWIDTLDNEARAHAASKGWDRLADDKAAATILESYRNLEKVRPAPAAVPATPAEYTFEPKPGVEENFLGFVRTVAHELKLPVPAAQTLATRLLAYADTAEADEATATAARVAAGHEAIKTAWGAEYETKSAVFARGIQALGLDQDTQNAIANSIGMDKFMETGYQLGAKMGEAPLIGGGGNVDQPKAPAMTRGQALEARNKMTSDPEFGAKLMAGDPEAVKKLAEVSEAIVGKPDAWQPPPENFGREHTDDGKEKAVDYSRYDVPAPKA